MELNSHISEVRSNGDRRSGKWNIRYLFTGQRRGPRRCKEQANFYVDRFQSLELKLVMTLLFLCLLDALFTLVHLQNGASELNPLLNFFYINFGFSALLLAKFLITLPALLFLLVHINFLRAKSGLWFLLAAYGILNIYHVLGFIYA